MYAAMQLLKGSVYEAQENWPLAARCYTAALRHEPLCYEALHRLVTNHMLSTGEQKELLLDLEGRLDTANAKWLQASLPKGSIAFPFLSHPFIHVVGLVQVYYRCKLDPAQGKLLAQAYERLEAAEKSAGEEVHVVDGLEGNFNIKESCDMLTAAAEYEYNHDHFRRCYQLSSRALAKDPFQQQVLPVSHC